MPGPVAALAGGSIVSGLVGARASSRAADAQADAARDAAELQREATQATIEEQRRQFDLSRGDLAPWRQAGGNALQALQFELGLGERPTLGGNTLANMTAADMPMITQTTVGGGGQGQAERKIIGYHDDGTPAYQGEMFPNYGNMDQYAADRFRSDFFRPAGQAPMGASTGGGAGQQMFQVGDAMFETKDAARAYAMEQMQGSQAGDGFEYRGFQETPGYAYAVEQDERALERAAAARGMRLSGATLNEAGRRAQGRANQEYGTYVNRLSSMAGVGQSAVNTGAQLGANTAGAIGNALMSGAQNQGNAIMSAGDARAGGYMGQASAFNNTMGNLFSVYAMNQAGAFGTPSQSLSAGRTAWGLSGGGLI